MQPDKESFGKQDQFPVIVFVVALLTGFLVGGIYVRHFMPDTTVWMMAGAILPPLGIMLGLALAEGIDAPLALMRVFSVLDGRHTFQEILALSGHAKSSLLVFPIYMTVATGALCGAGGLIIHIFGKPEVSRLDFVTYFGAAGVVYGVVMALILKYLTADEL